MTLSTTLTMVDGVKIVVPNDLDMTTPYVILEQQDWFEDEIKFLRRLLQPGQQVVDIGANYGAYTLSMARTVGAGGRVWAFEPASNTAKFLAEGIALNGFAQIVLERSALSSRCGTAQLALHGNAEENAVVRDASATVHTETVPQVTLDACLEKYGWREIDFIKIDAEGEEVNILKGGEQFFAELSPLVQYEIKEGMNLHLELVQGFADLGYTSYRLVPGLDLLIPFHADSAPDGYLLNLFCCKRDCAERLAVRGYLLLPELAGASDGENVEQIAAKIKQPDAYEWRYTIARQPYAVELVGLWEQTMAAGHGTEVSRALALYCISRDATIARTDRFVALAASFRLLKNICERDASYLRLASLARVARDYGARSIAVNALRQTGNTIVQNNQVDPSEPFLAPGERFDTMSPGEAVCNWIFAAVLEELERLCAFSSYYTGASALQRLEAIHGLGFGSAEMARRLQLVRRRIATPGAQ